MVTVQDIAGIMEGLAPPHLAESWDNVGLLAGDMSQTVQRVLVALDVTDALLDEALTLGEPGETMIVTHHPLIFKPIHRVTADTANGRLLLRTIRHGISLYAAHTNLDVCHGGTNDVLFDALSLMDKEYIIPSGTEGYYIGRTGFLSKKYPATLLKAMPLSAFAEQVGYALGLAHVNYVGDGGLLVRKVGLCTGAGARADYFAAAKAAKCDVYVTGDITYHQAQAASGLGLCLVDATHYASEAKAVRPLADYLSRRTEDLGLDVDIFASQIRDALLHTKDICIEG